MKIGHIDIRIGIESCRNGLFTLMFSIIFASSETVIDFDFGFFVVDSDLIVTVRD